MGMVFGYVRVSSPGQGDSGLGIEVQEDGIKSFYASKLQASHQWADMIADTAVSGSVEFGRRKGGAEIMRRASRGDIVIFYKFDRAFRDLRDGLNTLHKLSKAGAKVICLDFGGETVDTSTAQGEMWIYMAGLLARMEWRRCSDRMKDVWRVRKKNNEQTCGLQCGYKPYKCNGRRLLVPNMQERLLMMWCIEQNKNGYSYSELVKYLNQNNCQNAMAKNGGKWVKSSLARRVAAYRRLLEDEAAAGADGVSSFLMPNGEVWGIDRFPGPVQKEIRDAQQTWGQG